MLRQYKSHLTMQPEINQESQVISTLQNAIKWISNKEKEMIQEILSIEKALNKVQDSKQIIKKQYKQEVVDLASETQFESAQKHGKKIQQILEKADEELRNIGSRGKGKQSTINMQKKVQTLPTIQKKPPIPTNNRSKEQNIQSHFPKPNPYNRNKNEVTPKITDTPYLNRKSNSSNHRLKQSSTSSSKQISLQKKEIHSADKVIKKQKVSRIVFGSFQKSVAELISQHKQSNSKKNSSRKSEVDKLLGQLQKQELGYRQSSRKLMQSFLVAFTKLSGFLQVIPTDSSFQTSIDRFWNNDPQVFNFPELIEGLKSLISNNPISEQYRMEAKLCEQIKVRHQFINSIFEQHIQPRRASLQVPPKIGIQFTMNQNSSENSIPKCEIGDISSDQNIYEEQLYNILWTMLEELKSMDSFDKPALARLRIIVLIVLYNGRRSPTLVKSSKFQEWKSYYIQ